jgi:hypothetical protein
MYDKPQLTYVTQPGIGTMNVVETRGLLNVHHSRLGMLLPVPFEVNSSTTKFIYAISYDIFIKLDRWQIT